jgi:streptogramin lyase
MLEVPGTPADMVWDGGSLWYAGGSVIGQLDTASGKTFTYPLYGWAANRIASDGLGNIWFGAQGGAELGVLQSRNGTISMRSLNAMVQKLYALEVGSDRVWMSDSEGNYIYAFSIAESGETNSPEPLTLQMDRFTVSVSFPSLAWAGFP